MDNNQAQTPQQQPVTQTPETTAPRKSNTLVMLLGGIVLVGLGLLGGYFLFGNKTQPITTNVQTVSQVAPTNTPEVPSQSSETANWKTYTDSSLGFSFKYPQDTTVTKCNQTNIVFTMKGQTACESDSGGPFIVFEKGDSSSKLPEHYNRDYTLTSSSIKVGEKSGTKYSGTRSDDSPAPIPDSIQIIVVPLGKDKLLLNGIDAQILSTFTFQ